MDIVIFLGFYYDDPEITPPVIGVHRFSEDDSPIDSFTPEREVRAIVEGQFLAKYVHAVSLGYRITPASRILATGGASENKQILQVRKKFKLEGILCVVRYWLMFLMLLCIPELLIQLVWGLHIELSMVHMTHIAIMLKYHNCSINGDRHFIFISRQLWASL